MFCTFSLRNLLRATTACKFLSLIWLAGSQPALAKKNSSKQKHPPKQKPTKTNKHTHKLDRCALCELTQQLMCCSYAQAIHEVTPNESKKMARVGAKETMSTLRKPRIPPARIPEITAWSPQGITQHLTQWKSLLQPSTLPCGTGSWSSVALSTACLYCQMSFSQLYFHWCFMEAHAMMMLGKVHLGGFWGGFESGCFTHFARSRFTPFSVPIIYNNIITAGCLLLIDSFSCCGLHIVWWCYV